VTAEELIAYYDVADLFLCASEHEGFCVPLMEAFYKQIPVVALAATAVPATMDGGGVLYEDRDPLRVAALLDAVLSDGPLYDRVIASQDAAVARLVAKDFPGLLLRFVERTLASPRAAAPRVAFDFWDQLTAYERLEELRLFRPGIYKGLPRAEGSRQSAEGSRQ
jgi:glycosyltransferase involved in cell wall biosynthesis